MSFKKLNENLSRNLTENGITELNDFQKLNLSKYKQGGDFLMITDNQPEVDLAIGIGVVQRIEKASEDDAPRAIIYVNDKVRALELEKTFLKLTRRSDIRTVVLHDKSSKVYQRIDLYEGSDIIIGTPERIHAMYLQNGINLVNVKMFILDNLVDLFKTSVTVTQLNRVYESVPRCQSIIYSKNISSRVEHLIDLIGKNIEEIEFID